MSQIYASRKRAEVPHKSVSSTQPSLDALLSGAAQPTPNQMGHRIDLPEAMRTKMENAFGADLTAVKLYESQAVEDAGANAVTQGSNIFFAPGMADFTSFGGQALLGHEVSHVVSQARGEVTGSGFLNDHSLETRADREGVMAAAGRQITMPTASLSPVTAAPASGPMQADKKHRKITKHQNTQTALLQEIAGMQAQDPANYTNTRAYKKKLKDLQNANKWENYWRKKYKPGEAQPDSTGTLMLNAFRDANTDRPGGPQGLDQAGYWNAVNAGLKALPENMIQGDSALQERVLDESSAITDNARNNSLQSAPNQTWQALSSVGMNRPHEQALGTLQRKMIGEQNIADAMKLGTEEETIARLHQLSDEHGVTAQMRKTLNNHSFTGMNEDSAGNFDLSSATRSRMIGQDTLFRLAGMPDPNSADASPEAVRARSLVPALGLDQQSGALTPNTGNAAKDFLRNASSLTPQEIAARNNAPPNQADLVLQAGALGASSSISPEEQQEFNRRVEKYSIKKNPDGTVSSDYSGWDTGIFNASGHENHERENNTSRGSDPAKLAAKVHEEGRDYSGMSPQRFANNVRTMGSFGRTPAEIDHIIDLVLSPTKTGTPMEKDEFGISRRPDDVRKAQDADVSSGMHLMKDYYYDQMQMIKKKYGSFLGDMYPEDILKTMPDMPRDFASIQDMYIMLTDDTPEGGDPSKHLFDTRNNPRDKEFRDLVGYYGKANENLVGYLSVQQMANAMNSKPDPKLLETSERRVELKNQGKYEMPNLDDAPGFTAHDKAAYLEDLRRRSAASNGTLPLYGRFQ